MDENVTTTTETTEAQTTPEVAENSQPEQTQITEDATKEPEKSGDDVTETEGQEPTQQAPKDWEKIAKDNQASFTRVSQELAELKKQVEQSKPRLVQEGKINPEFEQRYKAQIDDMEFRAYDNLARQLEPETRAVVENLLNDARRLYNPQNKSAYEAKLGAIKDYFKSDLVIAIENDKQKYLGQIQERFSQELQKDKQNRANSVAKAIEAVPELSSLVMAESENYSPEVFGIVKTIFDLTGGLDVQATTSAISRIKEIGVKEYLAKQKAQGASDRANVPSGETVIQKSASGIPTRDELIANPKLYEKAVKKYGMEKVDAVIMKG